MEAWGGERVCRLVKKQKQNSVGEISDGPNVGMLTLVLPYLDVQH